MKKLFYENKKNDRINQFDLLMINTIKVVKTELLGTRKIFHFRQVYIWASINVWYFFYQNNYFFFCLGKDSIIGRGLFFRSFTVFHSCKFCLEIQLFYSRCCLFLNYFPETNLTSWEFSLFTLRNSV